MSGAATKREGSDSSPPRFDQGGLHFVEQPAMWDWDLHTNEITWNDAIARIVGCPITCIGPELSWWRGRVHPDDRPNVDATVRRTLESGGARWDLTYRMRRENGSLATVLERGFVVHREGRPFRIVGVLQEIATPSEQVEDELSLLARIEEREHQFLTFVESIPQLAWTATPDSWIDFYNQRWYDYTGTTFEQMEGWGWVSVHDPDDLPRVLKIWRNAFATGQPWEDEFRLRRGSDGMLRWHLSRAMPLRDAKGRIVRWFGTNTDIHDQKLAMEEYSRLLASEQRARRDAEAANRAKDEFLAVVSHELRTPLNAILGWSQMLLSGAIPENRRRTAIEKIDKNARLQARLIEDLLDVSRIITGKLQIDLKPVEIGKSVRAAVDTLKPVADEKKLSITLRDEAPKTRVRGSAHRLQQIVGNLLSNAIKFSPGGQRVEIRIGRSDGHVDIAVRDYGMGISPDFLPQLFSRFRQADSSSTRKHGGLGLGLSIVRELVELHSGEVYAESHGEGKGATFTVRLPVITDEELEAAPSVAAEEGAPLAMASLKGIKVLGVDDEGSARDILAEVLLTCGATVTLASSVHEALRSFKLDRPDIVVSDIAMPEIDGYGLLSRIRTLPDPASARTPIIALTAYASLQDRERALTMGFDGHLPKPLDPVRLSRLIAELVRSRILRGEK